MGKLVGGRGAAFAARDGPGVHQPWRSARIRCHLLESWRSSSDSAHGGANVDGKTCPTITSLGTPALLNSRSVATIAARSVGGKCWWIAGDHVVKLPLVIVFTTWTIAWWSAATKPGISAMSAAAKYFKV